MCLILFPQDYFLCVPQEAKAKVGHALRRHKLFLAAVRCLEVVGNIRKPESNKHELRQVEQGEDGDEEGGAEKEDLET